MNRLSISNASIFGLLSPLLLHKACVHAIMQVVNKLGRVVIQVISLHVLDLLLLTHLLDRKLPILKLNLLLLDFHEQFPP